MATIKRRGAGQFQVRIRRAGISKIETFSTKQAAQAWAAETEAKILANPERYRSEHERWQGSAKTCLLDLITRYLSEVTPTKKGAASEASRLRALYRSSLGLIPLNELSARHLNDYIAKRLMAVSPSTVNRDLNCLSHVLNTSRKNWGIAVANVVAEIQRPRSNKPRTRRLIDDEESRLMTAAAAARNPWLQFIVRVAIETAMRRGEILALEWRDVDFNAHLIHVRDSKTELPRSVPLTKAATTALTEWRKISKGQTGPVFGITANALKLSYQRAVRRSGIEGLTFHDLRHEATSRFFELHGLDIHEVMSATGHTSATMTERYTHLSARKISAKMRGGRIVVDLPDNLRKQVDEYAADRNMHTGDAIVRLLERCFSQPQDYLQAEEESI